MFLRKPFAGIFVDLYFLLPFTGRRGKRQIRQSIDRRTDRVPDFSHRHSFAGHVLEGTTLEELLDDCLERNDMDKFHLLFDEYLKAVSYHEDMPVTDYDLIFANILVTKDGEWHVIDYEWTFAKQVESKEIAFRAIYCYLLESEKRNKFRKVHTGIINILDMCFCAFR